MSIVRAELIVQIRVLASTQKVGVNLFYLTTSNHNSALHLRDRENSTVFVANLPVETTEDDLVKLFKDVRIIFRFSHSAVFNIHYKCGNVREVKTTHLPNMLVATIEFINRESVLAALTKDKKRLHDVEIAVHLAWQSTLYVTNFPEKVDDEFIRNLFGKVSVCRLRIIHSVIHQTLFSMVLSSMSAGRVRSLRVLDGSAMFSLLRR